MGEARADTSRNTEGPAAAEAPLRVVHPSWKNWWYLWALGWLGVPALAAAWLRAAVTVRIYRDRVFVSRGLIENDFEEIFIADIRTIEVRQTFRQRLRRIGDLAVTTAGRAGRTNVIRGLPRPQELKDLLIELREHLAPTEQTED